MVARTLDSTNSDVVWDNFHICQGHKANTPYSQIGKRGGKSHDLKLEKHPNAIRQAQHFKSLLDSGKSDSQSELARLTDTPAALFPRISDSLASPTKSAPKP